MLVLRDKQIVVLRCLPRACFEDALVGQCFAFYPRKCRSLGRTHIKKVVHFGVDRAMAQGYETQQDAAFFLSLMFLFGSFFDSDPQLPWAMGELGGRTLRQRAGRIQDVYRIAIEYLEQTAGDKNQHLIRALLRMRSFDIHSLPPSAGADFEQDLCAVLARLYPEKYAFQGEAVTRRLIRGGARAAARHGIDTNLGAAVGAALVFMLGDGVDRDPLYPWIGAALSDPSPTAPGARGLRLYEAAMDYLGKALTAK